MRPELPPRLYLRPYKDRPSVWIIRDRQRMITTGFGESDQDLAQEVLDAYCQALQVRPGATTIPQVMRIKGWVYFVSCEVLNFPIKIGWTSNVAPRLKSLQCALPYKVQLLAATRGSLEDETKFHVGFSQYRLEGEWFRRNPDLMALIERCAAKDAA